MMDVISAVSGGVAAGAATAAVYPLDTIVVRFQSAVSKRHGRQRLRQVLADALRHQDGILGLYKGMNFKIVEAFLRSFVYFYWYSMLKRLWHKKFGEISTKSSLLVASLAAALVQLVTVPLEVVSTNLQTTTMSLRQVLRYVYSQEGVRGFYRGFRASLVLCFNPAITNVVFDKLKDSLHSQKNEDRKDTAKLSSLQSFVLGALSKGVATAATYPYIRSKIVLQSSAGKKREYLLAKQRSRKSSVDLTSRGIPASKTNTSGEAEPRPRTTVARDKSGPELTTVASFCASEFEENKYNFTAMGDRLPRATEKEESSDDETSFH
eukprot:Selendium_serpulae@DN6418_c0_g2_i3.p1